MAFQLQPIDIAECYSLEEIQTEIDNIKNAINNARESAQDRFSDMQADQSVKRQKLEDLRNELAVYIKAKNILTGADSSTAELIAADYNPDVPRI